MPDPLGPFDFAGSRPCAKCSHGYATWRVSLVTGFGVWAHNVYLCDECCGKARAERMATNCQPLPASPYRKQPRKRRATDAEQQRMWDD